MSIHFVCGKPGGGKTMYAVKLIIEELRYGFRPVVTNVPLNLPRLNEYLQEKYTQESIDVRTRVKLLSEDQCREFWKHRRLGEEVPDGGAFIVLDELHLFFNAREWMHTGTACLHYLSQHRKLGDDVICVTQHVENVDKQFRSVAQDFSLIVNGFKQRIGIFKAMPWFTRYTYPLPPSGMKMQPDETAHFRLDAKGVASCYDTAAGIGVHGRGADKDHKAKGLPIWTFPVLAIAAVVVVMLGVKGCNRAVKAAMNSGETAVAHTSPASQGDAKQGGVVAPPAQETSEPAPRPQQNNRVGSAGEVADRPQVVQKLIRGDRRARIVLSDGRVFESSDDELEVVQPHRVKIAGEWYYYRQPGPGVRTLPRESVRGPQDTPTPSLPPPPRRVAVIVGTTCGRCGAAERNTGCDCGPVQIMFHVEQ